MALEIKKHAPATAGFRIVFHGDPKTGKTTFASKFPNCLVLNLENGLGENEVDSINIKSYDQFLQTVNELIATPFDYKNIVVDSIDWLEGMAFAKLQASGRVTSDDQKFGRDVKNAAGLFIEAITLLKRFQALGINVILICHSTVVKVQSPTFGDYHFVDLLLSQKSREYVTQWADTIGYISIVREIEAERKGKFKISKSLGHVLGLGSNDVFLAGSRYASRLPEEMGLDAPYFLDFLSGKLQKDSTDDGTV